MTKLQEIFTISLDFQKLEKIGYGGVKSHMLSELTDDIYNEFQEHYKVFTSISYNFLDVTDDVSE